jgi:hypothetical protein
MTKMANQSKSIVPSCLVGCLVVVIVFIAIGAGLVFVAKSAVNNLATALLDEAPMELPALDVSEEERAAILESFNDFAGKSETGIVTQPLELDERTLNTLLREKFLGEELGAYLYLSMEDDALLGKISMPADQAGPFAAMAAMFNVSDRFLNAEASFTLSFTNDRLLVFLDGITVKGQTPPEEMLQGMRAENLASDFNAKPELRKLLKHVESIVIADGKLIITPKMLDAPSTSSGAEE